MKSKKIFFISGCSVCQEDITISLEGQRLIDYFKKHPSHIRDGSIRKNASGQMFRVIEEDRICEECAAGNIFE